MSFCLRAIVAANKAVAKPVYATMSIVSGANEYNTLLRAII